MKKYSYVKDKVENILAVVIPSTIVGITMSCMMFIAMDMEVTEETFGIFWNISLIAGLVAAIFFSVKMTIYVMNEKQKQKRIRRNEAQILPFEKNSKLFEKQFHIS